ncbi:indolepyruvate ferredoxin oxidoreductase family protein [Dactylosporangium sp. AC04546]|uniref:indolepyruvate ferredoxin oxidoreductase family protein n=1 Tax=Dactylosporangium sp. AC04546 TaxID=2862460 RepID=UPI001EDC934E|nr:indolepyruvate ferredoxin oxidoreductase family protein [Dactylosporangium sp. AC04546]WVK86850.1 indolepyruvate ferredoxin oxidoreductase family protein [Dactylosporangium sp. AC04546]
MTALGSTAMSLTDKYERDEGEVFLSGLQALVRLPIEQRRLDLRRGLDTATMVSGYEGSPLAGYDVELARNAKLLDEHRVVVRPAVNEELAANVVQGSQLASASADRTCDGVVGIWYGKAPGLDRATDALRHANLGGADPRGGALVLVGDDSIAKSSTVPSSSEMAMAEIGMTVLSPSDPHDILTLGLHGIAMSRFSGLWTGMKLATNVVDGGATTRIGATSVEPVEPSREVDGVPYHHVVSASFLQPALGRLERSAVVERMELARRYARLNGLNRIEGDERARIGVVSAGATYRDVRHALGRLGLGPDLAGSGVRLLKLGMVFPLEPTILDEFADGLDEIVVVEEKRAFVELAIKDHFYGRSDAPVVTGRRDVDGAVLLRAGGDLPPEVIAGALHRRLRANRVDVVEPERPERPRTLLPIATRSPYFCSGCPHNRSTEVPDGSLVGAGIGCSGLASFMNPDRVGKVYGFTQMGGEGVPWIGMAPFVSTHHLIQNLGDGTFHHSGSLAVRASVAAGSRVTYKILYNSAVAMTGGQQPVGRLGVPALITELLAEGVRAVVVTTDDPKRYRRNRLPRGASVRHRDDLVAVQQELAAVDGVTVIIHDQECATELRRKRKRGLAPDPTARAFINERVCEGCGDCGAKSNCLSVQPIDTEFGRKTRIHQASCNKDYSCLDGDCPSFVTVGPARRGRATQRTAGPLMAEDLAAPRMRVPTDSFTMRITGIGGTGIVTAAQVLATAAAASGFEVQSLDQMGMAQKGGAVVSDLRFSRTPLAGANKVAAGECDLYLGCDLLVAADEKNLSVADRRRTIAVLSTSRTPTGAMVTDVSMSFPDVDDLVARTLAPTRRRHHVTLDAREASTALLGDDQFANIMLVGVAVQAGAIPLDPAVVEQALTLNGVRVEANIQAFRRGRQAVVDPHGFAAAMPARQPASSARPSACAALVRAEEGSALRAVVDRLSAELVAYQGPRLAERFARSVESVRARCAGAGVADDLVTAYARNLFKLMAYKDEYEVARLSLDPALREAVNAEFGADARMSFRLHPPVLRALGLKRKLTLGPWFVPVFVVLRAGRRLRGTPFDPFGIGMVRRAERALVGEYQSAVADALAVLSPSTVAQVAELVELPDLVRGYEHVKLRNVEVFRERVGALLEGLRTSGR